MTAKVEWDLRGVIVPLITPFKDDLSVDFPGVAKLVDYYIEEVGCDGLVPCGTTGESATLSHQEHAEVIEAVVKQTRGRVPVIASAGSNSTSEAVGLTRSRRNSVPTPRSRCGPYYNKPTQSGLFNHFAAIAASLRSSRDHLQHPRQDQPQYRAQDHRPHVGGDPERRGPEGLLLRHAPDHGGLPRAPTRRLSRSIRARTS